MEEELVVSFHYSLVREAFPRLLPWSLELGGGKESKRRIEGWTMDMIRIFYRA
jgi:hypothetical protein